MTTSLVHSHWSRNVEAWLSLVESFIMLKYFHGVATPALLCHKDRWLPYTERILYRHPMGVFCVPKPLVCDELVLYGIRELA